MSQIAISGIQQIGVGVKDVHQAWGWYKKYFGIDIRILEESAPAEFMLPYTGGKPKNRHAALAINLSGGGGFEIWNHTDFEPRKPEFEIQIGDLGIFSAMIKCKNLEKTYDFYKSEKLDVLGGIQDSGKHRFFFMRDLCGNIFKMVEGNNWYRKENKLTGGGYGAIIGCSNMEKSMEFYASLLGYDKIIYDKQGTFDDFKVLPGGDQEFRRVLLTHSQPRTGPFSELFSDSLIELVQVLNRKPRKIFENRYWGELGFIHLCFDIQGMDTLREECDRHGYPFTVDTGKIFKENSFDMGDAAGIFAYNEDPDGTLIEYVETHKIPIIKKLGISYNLQKRHPGKPLPRWLINAMRFLRAKDIKEPL